MKSIIHNEEVLFDEFFKVRKARLQHELYNGKLSREVFRYNYDKGDAVAALLVDSSRKELLIIEQYRYPAGRWIQELVAGGLEDDEDPHVGIDREIIEETEYKALSMEYLGLFYVAPGVFAERVHLFIADVRPATTEERKKVEKDDDEDICIVRIAFDDVMKYLTWPLDDVKTQLAIQHWLLNRNYE